METMIVLKQDALVFQDFEKCDVGLLRNKNYSFALFDPGQVMQYWGTLNGVKVWIEVDLLEPEMPMFRIAFGEVPSYPPQINQDEALKLLQEVCDVG